MSRSDRGVLLWELYHLVFPLRSDRGVHTPQAELLQAVGKTHHEQEPLRWIINPFSISFIRDIIKLGPEGEYFRITILGIEI
jgi:hypothetical protein